MSELELGVFSCPNCASDVPFYDDGRAHQCPKCRQEIRLGGHLCRQCHHYHDEEAVLCTECDSPMTRICSRCHTVNWIGTLNCKRCQHPLDISDIISRQDPLATSNRLEQQRAESLYFRAVENVASEQRMAQLRHLEERRAAEKAEAQRLIGERTRRLFSLVIFAFIVFALVLAIYVYFAIGFG